jgi:hypothetical protein
MKEIRHMSMNIEGALRNYGKKSMAGLITDDNGRPWSDKEVRKYLNDCLVKGWRLIPCCGKDCEGFDYQKGCPGHPVKEEE